MTSLIKSKSFSQFSQNGKIVDQHGFDAAYNGDKAVIDTMHNGKLFRIELENDEIFYLLKKIFENGQGNISASLKDSLMSDFNIGKSVLVKDLYKDKKHSKSLIASLFSDDDVSDDIVKDLSQEKTRKRGKKGKLKEEIKNKTRRKSGKKAKKEKKEKKEKKGKKDKKGEDEM